MNKPINTFKRYMTVKNVNKTINITIVGFFSYDQLDNALESPSNKIKKLVK